MSSVTYGLSDGNLIVGHGVVIAIIAEKNYHFVSNCGTLLTHNTFVGDEQSDRAGRDRAESQKRRNFAHFYQFDLMARKLHTSTAEPFCRGYAGLNTWTSCDYCGISHKDAPPGQ